LLIHIAGFELLKNAASQDKPHDFKGFAGPKAGCPQSYPQEQ
jgi:hypothetical protein